MIKLDYQTRNPRWELRGIKFSSWQSYTFTLGYLTNLNNYKLAEFSHGAISMRIERNDYLGAWDKEGRIYFYGTEEQLQRHLTDLYNACSAGVGKVIKRIDSNEYILSLIKDYEFVLQPRPGYSTIDVFPPEKEKVVRLLHGYLSELKLSNDLIAKCLQCFNNGYCF